MRQCQAAQRFIPERKAFSFPHFSACEGTGNSGRLPAEYADQYRDEWESIVYTVYSYSTPIAWILRDGTVRFPAVRYSLTTSSHQRITADALGIRYELWDAPRAVPVGTFGPRPSGW